MIVCTCDLWAVSESCPIHGDEEHRTPTRCHDCGQIPEEGERHSLLDGTTDDGEPLGFTCLDADGEVLLPPVTTGPVTPDPWSTPSSEPPPF